jgi:hypothetical protein
MNDQKSSAPTELQRAIAGILGLDPSDLVPAVPKPAPVRHSTEVRESGPHRGTLGPS